MSAIVATQVQRQWLLEEVLKDGSGYYEPVAVMRACVKLADNVLLDFDGDGALESLGLVFGEEEFWYLGEADGWDEDTPYDEVIGRMLAKSAADEAVQRAFIFRCLEIMGEDGGDVSERKLNNELLRSHVRRNANAALSGESGRALAAKFGELDAAAAAMRDALLQVMDLGVTGGAAELAEICRRALEPDAGGHLLKEVHELRRLASEP